jgi:mannose-6-phosphate isomerase-like protein (cupin superfamily)/uncharacterized glyoxalase superfamily protein PhnB
MALILIHEHDTRVDEPPPHGAIGTSTAWRISDAAPQPRTMEFRKRVLHVGAAIGLHALSHDEVYYVLAGEGEVTSDGETRRLAAGMAAYLYDGAVVGIRQVGDVPLALIVSYPNPSFATAAALPPNRSMPQAAVLPELAYPDVNTAADWLSRAFGFSVRLRIGDHRVQMTVPGGGALIVRQGEGPPGCFAAHSVMVRVADIDAHHAHAVAACAVVAGAPTTYPYGERQYGARDLVGHAWVFTQTVKDVDPADWGGELPLR